MCKEDKQNLGKQKNNGEDEGEITMATQIAPTPILYGEEARRVIREAKTMPSEKSKENGQKLLNYFKRFTNK